MYRTSPMRFHRFVAWNIRIAVLLPNFCFLLLFWLSLGYQCCHWPLVISLSLLFSYWCFRRIFNAAGSSSSFYSWQIKSVYVISRVQGLVHHHQLSCLLIRLFGFFLCPLLLLLLLFLFCTLLCLDSVVPSHHLNVSTIFLINSQNSVFWVSTCFGGLLLLLLLRVCRGQWRALFHPLNPPQTLPLHDIVFDITVTSSASWPTSINFEHGND